MTGVDYSWARPGGAALQQSGYGFAARYLSHDTGKNISAGEANDLRTHDVDIVLVWESTASRALSGHDAGVQDAKDAAAQCELVGAPGAMPIYFAVDFDATPGQQANIDDYLRGAASVIGIDRVGVYGGFYIVQRCHDNGTAKWFWQTLAWSGGQQFSGNHIYQDGRTDFNGGCDIDEAKQDNYGQWSKAGGGQPVPAPSPAPTPAPAGGSYTVVSGDTLSGIASRFGTTYQYLAQINGIADPNKIYTGQVLKVPGGSDAPAPAPQPNGQTYTVRSGDTLSAIGAKLGVDWHTIASVNGLADPNLIYPGQVLRLPGTNVPTPAPGQTHYTVQSGDTLSAIAAKYGTNYQHLAQINGIADPNLIYPGQVLLIS